MILVLFALLLIIALVVGIMWARAPKQQLRRAINKLNKLTKSSPPSNPSIILDQYGKVNAIVENYIIKNGMKECILQPIQPTDTYGNVDPIPQDATASVIFNKVNFKCIFGNMNPVAISIYQLATINHSIPDSSSGSSGYTVPLASLVHQVPV
jgi:hypothetical protein